MKRMLIVDDHAMVRRGIAITLKNELDSAPVVCDEASSGEDALALLELNRYDGVILDITLPGMDGLETLVRIRKTMPTLPVLVISMHPEDHYGLRAIRLGASGYLTKLQAADELVIAVNKILAGHWYVSPHMTRLLVAHATSTGEEQLAGRPSHSQLTNREFLVMKHLAAGKKQQTIAGEMGFSTKTISICKQRIFKKMNFSSIADLVTYMDRCSAL